MSLFIIILIIVFAGIILIQDFYSRSVFWFLFPLLGLCGVVLHMLSHSKNEVLKNIFINILIASLQFFLLLLYFYFRKIKKPTSLFQKIGLGDILFVYASCFFFSPFNFLFFYVLSLAFSLLFHFLFLNNLNYSKHDGTIALAGWQSLFLLVVIGLTTISQIDIYSDNLILQYLRGK